MLPRSVLFACLLFTACGGAAPPDDPTAPAEPPRARESAGTASAPAAPPARGDLACEQKEEFGPYVVSAEHYEGRYGADAARFSELRTTKAHPLEACGPERSLALLTRLTCDDGSSPFGGDPQKAEAARQGMVGAGGRCGGIVDLFEVECPEKTYRVYVDMYFCGPGMEWP